MNSKQKLLEHAEATGYILRSDGSQIVSSMATPADLIYHVGVKNKVEVEEQTQHLIKHIEGMKDLKNKTDRWRYNSGELKVYNQALQDILDYLKSQ